MDEKACPDCGNDPTDRSLHRATCPRVSSCGQVGPPWPSPPFHRYPDELTKAEYLGDLTEHRGTAHSDSESTV